MISHPSIVARVVDAAQAASPYRTIMSDPDEVVRLANFRVYTFERAKDLVDLHATLDHRCPREIRGTDGYVCIVTRGWRVTVKVNLITGEALVVDDERKPSLFGRAS